MWRARRAGIIGGAIGALFIFNAIVLFGLEVGWQVIGGPQAEDKLWSSRSDARVRALTPQVDDKWPKGMDGMDHGDHDHDHHEEDWDWTLQLVIRLGIPAGIAILEALTFWCYWRIVIMPTAEKYLPARVIVPQDLKGKWAYPLFDCCANPGRCCCHIFCPACTQAEVWYRMGFMHTISKQIDVPRPMAECCPGWEFCAGVLSWCFIEDTFPCCSCCGWAVIRGGMGWAVNDNGGSGLGELVDHRTRFEIPHAGFNTFLSDCCIWCWCAPCANVQEYRQIMALLNRSPLEVAPPPVPAMVGVPVQVVGQPIQVQATVVTNAKETG